MKVVEGVNLHIVKTEQFKNNTIKIRFSSPYEVKRLAKRLLVSQMLETANSDYPTLKKFKEKLADLYGASFTSQVGQKGLVHYVDIDLSFIRDDLIDGGHAILDEMISLIRSALFAPLSTVEQYSSKVFDFEYDNLKLALQAETDDPYTLGNQEIQKLFYQSSPLAYPSHGTLALLEKENNYTSYQEFQRMLKEDTIDIYFVGKCDDYHLLELLNEFPLAARERLVPEHYQHELDNLIREKSQTTIQNQSILHLAYLNSIQYQDAQYPALVVFNTILGASPSSLLFTKVREKEGLAYNIDSQLDAFTGMIKIEAGIETQNRIRCLQLINRNIKRLKQGRFKSTRIQEAKQALRNSYLKAQDNPYYHIERLYHQDYYQTDWSQEGDWLEAIESVHKSDVMAIAKQMKLTAIHVIEGSEL